MAPFTDDERRQVAELHTEGKGRNQISRETGIHQKRVSAIATELGLSFRRGGARTAVATEHLADDRLVNGNEIPTGTPRLTAVYVPNVKPNPV